MDTYTIEKYKRDIAIILQNEQYKNVTEVDEELLVQIIGFLKDSEKQIDYFIAKQNKPQGEGTYMA